MGNGYVLTLADPRATLEVVGGKGASLARLSVAGLPVPDGFHITTAAYERFVSENHLQPQIEAAVESADPSQPATLEAASHAIQEAFSRGHVPEEIVEAIAVSYAALPGEHPTVAVRSSATAEDLPELSFAGQQETFLNIHGVAAVQQAVVRCWASLWTARAIGYRAQHGVDRQAVSLAVVVQLLVRADSAGILFTANPLTGQRDQAVINAAWGLGEAVVGGVVTPDTLVVDKASGRLLRRETADKQVMTVLLESSTTEQPVPETLRQAPVLSDREAAELVRLGAQIETLYGMPMDIEWALAEGRFAIVQARPITALPRPEPEAPLPIEWKLPDAKGQYMRTSIIDLMPDPLTPLFATMGLPAISAGIGRMVEDALRTESGLPDELLVLINGYAYYVGRFTLGQWWWMLSRMLPSFPHILRTGVSYWRDQVRPRYVETVTRWQEKPLPQMASDEIQVGAREVLAAAADHLGALMIGTMGASAGSEGLFTAVYGRIGRGKNDPAAATFLMGYDSTPIRAGKSLYDLAEWCKERAGLADHILRTPSEQLVAELDGAEVPAGVSDDQWQAFRQRCQGHLRRYGHIIYTLDFGQPLPLDDPAPMLATCRMYLRGEGANPHERQRSLEARRMQATEALFKRLRGLRLWALRKTLSWAQSLAAVREDGIADIGLGYPLLRRMLWELGCRLVRVGAIEQPDDIFWLTGAEAQGAVAALESGEALSSMAETVERRRAVWRAQQRMTPPPMLPPSKRYMGFSAELFIAAAEDSQGGDTLKGVGASAGRIMAAARVLHGPEDFAQMKPGEVLVAPITTPAWTPLFAMASAVVTDVGGPLSHGSIVAREYGIPAVLGVGVATRRIHSGQMVIVDGSAGTVTLIRGEIWSPGQDRD